MAFKAVQGGGADAAVEFQVFFDHPLIGHFRVHVVFVTGFLQFLAGHGRENALVAPGEQVFVNAHVFVADGFAQRGVVARSAARLTEVGFIEVEHAVLEVFAQEFAHAAHDPLRFAHQLLVLHVQPESLVPQGFAPLLDRVPAAFPGMGRAINVGGSEG